MAYRPYQSKSNETAQRAIGNALLDLLEEKSLSSISIKELCERAGVSRPTFYRHFDTVNDVLELYACDISRRLDDIVTSVIGHGMSGKAIITRTCEGFLEFRELFDIARRGGFIAPLFGHLWTLSGQLMPQLLSFSSDNPLSIDYDTLIYSQGGAFALLFSWIISDMSRSPEEMGEAVMRAAQQAGTTFTPEYREVSSLISETGIGAIRRAKYPVQSEL